MRTRMWLLGVATALPAMAFGMMPAHAGTIVVDPANPNGWAFSNLDNSPAVNASGQFVTGPAPAPLGIGSANLVVNDASSSEILINGSLAPGTPAFTTLSYETYVTTSSAGSGAAATLQFDLFDGATYEGRLVFDPGLTGGVVDATWQTWDTTNTNAWYFSHATKAGAPAGFSGCSIAGPTYCSLSTVENVLSTDGIVASDVLFKAGSGQPSFNGNVDNLHIAFGATDDTFDFDPGPSPVPEPASLVLLGSALLGFGLLRRRRN